VSQFVVIESPGATDAQQAAVLSAIADGGGSVLLGLGLSAAVVDGDQTLVESLQQLEGVDGVVTDPTAALPASVDADLADLIAGVFISLSPAFVASKQDPDRNGVDLNILGGCGLGE
jgi:hypothetical protein